MKFKLIISFLLFSIMLSAQTKVPKAVKDSFAKLYPTVTSIKWEKEGKTEFEGNFKLNKVNTSVVFDVEGNLMETETAIPVSELPPAIAKYVAEQYKGYKISGAAKIVDNKDVLTYEAEISKKKVKKDIMFDKDGNPVKK